MEESAGNIEESLLNQIIEHTVFALESIITIFIIIIVVITLVSFFRIMLSRLKKRDKEQQPAKIHNTVVRMLRGLLVSLDSEGRTRVPQGLANFGLGTPALISRYWGSPDGAVAA